MYLIFFFTDTATTEIYTLSLHDALPIFLECWSWQHSRAHPLRPSTRSGTRLFQRAVTAINLMCRPRSDRKSTRLNSSHSQISYAVFCLKKKKNDERVTRNTELCTSRHCL